MNSKNRASFIHKMRYAVRHPGRISSYTQRWARDAWFRMTTGDHVSYYRAVMRSDSARNPEQAVGSASHDRWLALGKMQYDYLIGHGLLRSHRLLEIGCGNLRAGWRFIDYLEPGHYYGIDISPDILFSAQNVLHHYDLQHKLPHLTPVRNLNFSFLPHAHFDVVHAHSVFSHSPLEVIDECLSHVGAILTPRGFFDFTFDRTTGAEHQVLREDFYYRTETLTALARRHGLKAHFMQDWEELPHKQSKIRITHL